MSGPDLTDRIVEAQDTWLAESSDLTDTRARLEHVDVAANRPWVGPVAMAAVVLLSVGVGYGVLSEGTSTVAPSIVAMHGGQALRIGEAISASDVPSVVAFSDGSAAELGVGSLASLTRIDGLGATVNLDEGSLSLDVAKLPDADWGVSAGPFDVAVTGTAFTTSWDPDTQIFTVQMRHGSVFVAGPLLQDGKAVAGTEVLRVHLREGRSELVNSTDVSPVELPELVEAVVEVDDLPTLKRAPTAAPVTMGPTWQELVAKARYTEAVAMVEAAGLTSVLATASAIDAYGLADAARLVGRHDLAMSANTHLRANHAGSASASSAAFSLGRHAYDITGDVDAAIRWWQLYLDERPDGELAPEALGRLMEAHKRAGNKKVAKQLAEQYLDTYPQGSHATFAKSLTRRR